MKLKNIFGKSKKRMSALEFMALEEARQRRELTDKQIKVRMERIEHDFRLAFDALKGHTSTVTFFGSSVIPETSPYYQHARELARKIVEQLGLTIVSGAGPGIMEASNRGAYEADKENSVGMAIQLPHEQETNHYVSHSANFYYFFSRKMALTFTARAYIFFPGGYGTLDELFEILTLKKNGKIPPLPVILFESEFWSPLHNYLNEVVYKKTHAINKDDMDIYVITDDQEEVLNIIAGRGL